MNNKKDILFLLSALVLILLLFWINLVMGVVDIPSGDLINLLIGGEVENSSWSYIVENRLNRSIVAIGAGGALAVSGLILQVFFRNPLAGPGVLGITSGASLGVAVVLLGGIGLTSAIGDVGLILAGILGALAVLFLLLIVSKFIYNAVTLLVVGLMFGYFTSALINILFLWAGQSETREYVVWGLGSFEGLSTADTWFFLVIILIIAVAALTLTKTLNALVLGSEYASSLGLDLKKSRLIIILITGVLAAIVTVYCGPISFIGIAVPQIVRIVAESKNHFLLIPFAFALGSILALLSDITVRLSENALPLNTVTAIVGAPVIIWTIIKMNKRLAKF